MDWKRDDWERGEIRSEFIIEDTLACSSALTNRSMKTKKCLAFSLCRWNWKIRYIFASLFIWISKIVSQSSRNNILFMRCNYCPWLSDNGEISYVIRIINGETYRMPDTQMRSIVLLGPPLVHFGLGLMNTSWGFDLLLVGISEPGNGEGRWLVCPLQISLLRYSVATYVLPCVFYSTRFPVWSSPSYEDTNQEVSSESIENGKEMMNGIIIIPFQFIEWHIFDGHAKRRSNDKIKCVSESRIFIMG